MVHLTYGIIVININKFYKEIFVHNNAAHIKFNKTYIIILYAKKNET